MTMTTTQTQKRLDTATTALEAAKQRVETTTHAYQTAREKKALARALDEMQDAELDVTLAERELEEATEAHAAAQQVELDAELAEVLPRCDVDAVMAPHVDRLVDIFEELATIHDDAMTSLRALQAANREARELRDRGASGAIPRDVLASGDSPRKTIRKMVEARVGYVDERASLIPVLKLGAGWGDRWTRHRSGTTHHTEIATPPEPTAPPSAHTTEHREQPTTH